LETKRLQLRILAAFAFGRRVRHDSRGQAEFGEEPIVIFAVRGRRVIHAQVQLAGRPLLEQRADGRRHILDAYAIDELIRDGGLDASLADGAQAMTPRAIQSAEAQDHGRDPALLHQALGFEQMTRALLVFLVLITIGNGIRVFIDPGAVPLAVHSGARHEYEFLRRVFR